MLKKIKCTEPSDITAYYSLPKHFFAFSHHDNYIFYIFYKI
jgi:hypothetical protein